jgi:hypothetical protein
MNACPPGRSGDGEPDFRGYVPVAEWPKEVDEQVLLYVVHDNAKYENDPEKRRELWEAWCAGYWTDFNGGGWVWHGMGGRVTHVAALPDRPTLRSE